VRRSRAILVFFKTSPADADTSINRSKYGHGLMQPHVGTLSNDGFWFWDGAQWSPSYSPDGRWWWNGTTWTAVVRPAHRFWNPAWLRSDYFATFFWLSDVAFAIALATVAVFAVLVPGGIEGLIALSAAYGTWAFVGGFVVRPHGRWWEVFLLAAALVAVVIALDFLAYFVVGAAGQDQSGDDNGVAVGLVFLVFFVFPRSVLPVAFGKFTRQVLSRARSDRVS
jgi:hypothetical protein